MKVKAISLLIAVLMLVIGFSTSFAFSEDDSTDTMQYIREEIRADKKQFIALNMLFTKTESEKFWPLYDQYQKELEALGRRYGSLMDTYTKEYLDMMNEMAASLLDDMITVEGDFQNLRKSYLPRFRKILPNRKVTRYFQLETKIQAVLRFDAAVHIPLT